MYEVKGVVGIYVWLKFENVMIINKHRLIPSAYTVPLALHLKNEYATPKTSHNKLTHTALSAEQPTKNVQKDKEKYRLSN